MKREYYVVNQPADVSKTDEDTDMKVLFKKLLVSIVEFVATMVFSVVNLICAIIRYPAIIITFLFAFVWIGMRLYYGEATNVTRDVGLYFWLFFGAYIIIEVIRMSILAYFKSKKG